MADESIKQYLRRFLDVVSNEIADPVVDAVIKSDMTIPINSSKGDPRATAEEHLAFQTDLFQVYGHESKSAALQEQFFASNTFSITLSGPDDLTPVDSQGRRFYSINLTTPQRQLLQRAKRLVVLVRLFDYDTFDTHRRGSTLGIAVGEALANKTGGVFETVLVHFHFESRHRVSWVMRIMEMGNIVLGMLFGGVTPRCAPQLRFALTDASSHPLFDATMVHKPSEATAALEWTAGELSGFAKNVVDTVFEQTRGKPLRVEWK